jgi:sulfur carrier protein
MSLTLILNGQSRTFDSLSQSASLEQLIGELGLKGDRVAVEHNGEIVPRTSWAEAIVSGGDRLEVVHFVGGGSSGAFRNDRQPTAGLSLSYRGEYN